MASLKQLSEASNIKSAKTWACVACTYLNDIALLQCEICTTERPCNDMNKRTKLDNEINSPSSSSGSSSSSVKSSHIGPAAFIAAISSLAPTASALNAVPVWGNTANPLMKRSFGAGNGKLRLLSWNTDGIFDKGFCKERAVQASQVIIGASPDVILLQELVPDSFSVFRAQLENAGYIASVPSQPHPAPYFCGIFTSNCLTVETTSQNPFECGSYMYRDLSRVTVTGGPLEGGSEEDKQKPKCVHVYTSHLESMKSEGAIGRRSQDYRVKQLLETTNLLLHHASSGEAALFAGDTNLRNDEVANPKAATDLDLRMAYDAAFRPKKSAAIVDAFELAGEPGNHKFTWDCMLNDNLGLDFKPRARYDRCFLTRDLLSVSENSFHLLGTSKFMLPSNGKMMFPSDHFGICMDLVV